MESTKKRKKGWWKRWAKIAIAVIGIINPGVGAVLGIVYTAITSSEKSLSDINPTDAELIQARTKLKPAILTINAIDDELQSLKTSTLTKDVIINKLNVNLKQIATMQAYIKLSKIHPEHILDYIVSLTIEPLMAKLNTIVTEVINAQNLQSNIELSITSFNASDTHQVRSYNLNWYRNNVLAQFEELVQVSASTTDTVITASLDNNELSVVIDQINQESKPKSNLKGWLIALGVGTMIYLGRKSGEKSQKEKLGLQGKKCGKDRYACKEGINKKTGNTKKGYSRGKGGSVKKVVKGLDKNGHLKKGFKYENKKVVAVKKSPAKKKSYGMKAPILLEL